MTAVLLAEAARTLLQDDLGLKGGVFTPASLGQGYLDHLNDNGFKVETKILDI